MDLFQARLKRILTYLNRRNYDYNGNQKTKIVRYTGYKKLQFYNRFKLKLKKISNRKKKKKEHILDHTFHFNLSTYDFLTSNFQFLILIFYISHNFLKFVRFRRIKKKLINYKSNNKSLKNLNIL